jgi:hypothetical protein
MSRPPNSAKSRYSVVRGFCSASFRFFLGGASSASVVAVGVSRDLDGDLLLGRVREGEG